VSTVWLLVLTAIAFVGYYPFPHKWASAMAVQGLVVGLLFWSHRGPRFKARWFVCLIGLEEGLQVFGCQMAWNWWPVKERGAGLCEAYTGLPFFWAAAWAIYIIAVWMLHGHNTHD
jgi:hypothetical protein